MRITIDTELQAIIVPDSYYLQVDKLNEIITGAGAPNWTIKSISRLVSTKRMQRRLSVSAMWRG